MQLGKLATNRNLYALHRWISLLVVIQLAVWATSGLVFAFIPARSITSTVVEHAHEQRLQSDRWLAPDEVLARVPAEHRSSVFRLELRRADGGPVWLVRGPELVERYDAVTGERSPLGEDEAGQIAAEDQEGHPAVRDVTRYEGSPPIEYRGRSLPAYRVSLDDDAGTVVWVDARTGDVTARRTDRWRLYDFFWALHIMDYTGREDIHHPLLIAFAALAELTALTGLVLWVRRLPRRRDRTGTA